ncbi:hypothetical protein [Streptomyces chattanoogensis]|uniref:hypothetical protein n=1 Tax=Streptomyces chattanoogensis TaxID=66876 RepID=UPI00367B3BEA
MTGLIHRTLTHLQSLLIPRGRHRAKSPTREPHPVRPAPQARPTARRPRRPGPYATDVPLDGHATAMVRPYLLVCETEAVAR